MRTELYDNDLKSNNNRGKNMKSKSKKLSELSATAISGNDIISTCLYVSAMAIIFVGQYAWISLLIVGGVLFLFRKIYGEVVGALPLNVGAFNDRGICSVWCPHDILPGFIISKAMVEWLQVAQGLFPSHRLQ